MYEIIIDKGQTLEIGKDQLNFFFQTGESTSHGMICYYIIFM